MGKRNFEFYNDGIYHVYNRGVDKRIIFEDLKDYQRFLVYLELCQFDFKIEQLDRKGIDECRGLASTSKQLVEIECFCLLGNHYHLLARQLVDRGVSEFMQKLGTAYTMYFNAKHERSGSLFQGKFKAKPVESEGYYELVRAYVTLNYLVHGAQTNQYFDCLGDLYSKGENKICSERLLKEFPDKESMIHEFKQRLAETISRRELERDFTKILID